MRRQGPSDAASYAITYAIYRAATSGAVIDEGTRNLVLHLAATRPSPPHSERRYRLRGAHTRYIYIVYDDDAFDVHVKRLDVDRLTSLNGCSKLHHFQSVGTEETHVRCKRSFCACSTCIAGEPSKCSLKDAVGEAVSHRIEDKVLTEMVLRQEQGELAAFARTLKVSHAVAVRIPRDMQQASTTQEPFWLGRIIKAPEALTPERHKELCVDPSFDQVSLFHMMHVCVYAARTAQYRPPCRPHYGSALKLADRTVTCFLLMPVM